MSVEERVRQGVLRIREVKLNWAGHEALFLRLLRLRDTQLAIELLDVERFDTSLGELSIGPIEWWLEWLMDEAGTKAESGRWFGYMLGQLFAQVLNSETRRAFVAELNKAGSRFGMCSPILFFCIFPTLLQMLLAKTPFHSSSQI